MGNIICINNISNADRLNEVNSKQDIKINVGKLNGANNTKKKVF